MAERAFELSLISNDGITTLHIDVPDELNDDGKMVFALGISAGIEAYLAEMGLLEHRHHWQLSREEPTRGPDSLVFVCASCMEERTTSRGKLYDALLGRMWHG